MKRTKLLLLALTVGMLACSAMAQSTFYVGTCQPGSFATISAAVNSPNVPAGSFIDVCPGVYYEQVIITKSLTLQGIYSTQNAAATIVGSPADSTILNSSGNLNRPSILVENATVNISKINITQIHADTDCSAAITGIFYASGSSGTTDHVNVSILSADADGCPVSIGFWAENEDINLDTVVVQNSTFEAEDEGIVAISGQPEGFAPVLSFSATGNHVYMLTPDKSGADIFVTETTGTISSNILVGSYSGIVLYTDAYIVVSGNTIDAYDGIDVYLPKPTITGNKIRANTGINLICNQATVSQNTFFGGWGGLASTGLYQTPVGFTSTNKFYNITTLKGPGC